jgi:hypothetical protein
MTEKQITAAAAAIANERAGRRGAPAVVNVLDILPDKLRTEVTEDARAALRAAAEATEPKHVYEITDGGESYWYVAADATAATRQHVQLNYVEAGVALTPEVEAQLSLRKIPNDKTLTVEIDAGDMAKLPDGLYGCTAC